MVSLLRLSETARTSPGAKRGLRLERSEDLSNPWVALGLCAAAPSTVTSQAGRGYQRMTMRMT
jgi:hypothetical protein